MKYIIREGTVRGQGRYWSFEAGAGRSGYFWAPDDPVFYTGNVDEVRRQARAIGGRVVRLTTKAERAVREDVQRLLLIEEQAKRVVRAERWHRWARRAHYGIAYGDPEWRGSGIGNAFALAIEGLDDERRKLTEMVGEGDES